MSSDHNYVVISNTQIDLGLRSRTIFSNNNMLHTFSEITQLWQWIKKCVYIQYRSKVDV